MLSTIKALCHIVILWPVFFGFSFCTIPPVRGKLSCSFLVSFRFNGTKRSCQYNPRAYLAQVVVMLAVVMFGLLGLDSLHYRYDNESDFIKLELC